MCPHLSQATCSRSSFLSLKLVTVPAAFGVQAAGSIQAAHEGDRPKATGRQYIRTPCVFSQTRPTARHRAAPAVILASTAAVKSASDRDNPDGPRPISVGAAGDLVPGRDKVQTGAERVETKETTN